MTSEPEKDDPVLLLSEEEQNLCRVDMITYGTCMVLHDGVNPPRRIKPGEWHKYLKEQ